MLNLRSNAFVYTPNNGEIGMSRETLYRKVKGLKAKTAIDYIRIIRLNEAMKLL